jgi:hypothetical protein
MNLLFLTWRRNQRDIHFHGRNHRHRTSPFGKRQSIAYAPDQHNYHAFLVDLCLGHTFPAHGTWALIPPSGIYLVATLTLQHTKCILYNKAGMAMRFG